LSSNWRFFLQVIFAAGEDVKSNKDQRQEHLDGPITTGRVDTNEPEL
jgi:hypothetical protein